MGDNVEHVRGKTGKKKIMYCCFQSSFIVILGVLQCPKDVSWKYKDLYSLALGADMYPRVCKR